MYKLAVTSPPSPFPRAISAGRTNTLCTTCTACTQAMSWNIHIPHKHNSVLSTKVYVTVFAQLYTTSFPDCILE